MYSLEAAEVRNRICLLVPEYVPYSPEDRPERVAYSSPECPAIGVGVFRPLRAPLVQNLPAAMAGV
jgi:hypothetical protein